jgi:hypothetical protein
MYNCDERGKNNMSKFGNNFREIAHLKIFFKKKKAAPFKICERASPTLGR